MLLSCMISRFKSKKLIAVDWSDYFLRIVVLIRNNESSYDLAVADCVELEPGVIENGQIIDFIKVSESLLTLLETNKIRHKKIAFVVDGTNIISKNLRFDESLTESQIHDEILLDFNKHVSYPVEETFYDFEVQTEISSKGNTKQEVMFVASHKEQIAQYEQLAKICGLKMEVIDIDNYVLQRYVEIFYPEDKMSCWVLICLNSKCFKLSILDGSQIYLSEQKTISAGLNDSEYLNALNTWLMRNLQMFNVSNRGKKPEKFILYGDRVEVENLVDNFKKVMQLTVSILNPFAKLANYEQAANIKHRSSYLLTVGLATRIGGR